MKVDQTIQEWSYYANITFKRVDSEGQIRITFDENLGSWSYVGKDALRVDSAAATLNLGWVTKTSSLGAYEKGTILHEFGHALGLGHELQSPARKGALKLDEEGEHDMCIPNLIL